MSTPRNSEKRLFSLSLHGGAARFHCTIDEVWKSIFSIQLVCGNSYTKTLERTIGFSQSEKEELETTVTASLGIKDLAGLEAKLATKLGSEFRFEETTRSASQFTFQAPTCGRLTVKLYQRVRQYQFTYQDSRLFRKSNWTKRVDEPLEDFYDGSVPIKNDPVCGCSTTPSLGFDSELALKLKNTTVLIGCIHTNKGLSVPLIQSTFPAMHLANLIGDTFDLVSNTLPPHIIFLDNITSVKTAGTFSYPSTEGWQEDLLQGTARTRGVETETVMIAQEPLPEIDDDSQSQRAISMEEY